MASPVDSARQGTNITTAGTSHAINVGSPAAGTLLIVFVRFAAAPGTVTFTGYTQLASDSSDASDDTTAVYYRMADGTEGATDTLSTTNSVKLAAICWEVTGAREPTAQAPEISAVAVGTTTANTANPGQGSVTGGPRDVLYLALAAQDGEVGAYTAAPTNYSNLATANSGTGGAAATNCYMGGASRAITASSSDDPGAFTHGAATTGWTAFTVVIHPAQIAFTITPAGSITPSGALAKTVSKPMAGSITPAGALVLLKLFTITVGGSITPVGTLQKSTVKVVGGSIAPTGSLAKQTAKLLAGSITPAGSLRKTVGKPVAGAVTPTGSLTKSIGKQLAGAIAPSGTIRKDVVKRLAGVVTPIGDLATVFTPGGGGTPFTISVGGSITPVGTLTKAVVKNLAGSITPTGTVRKDVAKLLAGGIVPTGSIRKSIGKFLGGVVTPIGNLLTQLGGPSVQVKGSVDVSLHTPAAADVDVIAPAAVDIDVLSPADADVSEA